MADSRDKGETPARGFLVMGVVVGAMTGLLLTGGMFNNTSFWRSFNSYDAYLIAKETVPFEFALKGAAVGLILGLIMDARANGALAKSRRGWESQQPLSSPLSWLARYDGTLPTSPLICQRPVFSVAVESPHGD